MKFFMASFRSGLTVSSVETPATGVYSHRERYARDRARLSGREIGSAKRSRARDTRSSTSFVERSGRAAITISSAGKVGNASAIAWRGSASPTRPST